MAQRGSKPGERRGGRKKGTPNKIKVAKQDIASKLIVEGMTPLEVMLKAMREQLDAGNLAMAHAFAKDAAPYLHHKLSAIEHTGKDGEAIKVEHSDAERLAAWRLFAAKVSVIQPVQPKLIPVKDEDK